MSATSDLGVLQERLDAIAERCQLHLNHRRLVAFSETMASIEPRPEVRLVGPTPAHLIAAVRAELAQLPGVTLRGYPR